jgi:acyl carrier protein
MGRQGSTADPVPLAAGGVRAGEPLDSDALVRRFVRQAIAAVVAARHDGPARVPAAVAADADLQADIGLTSIEVVELSCVVADGTGVDLAAAAPASVGTVADLEAVVLERMSAAGRGADLGQLEAALAWLQARPAPTAGAAEPGNGPQPGAPASDRLSSRREASSDGARP